MSNFKYLVLIAAIALTSCKNEPIESFAVAAGDYSMQVALFKDSTFMMQVDESDSNFTYLGNWRKTKAEDTLTLNILRKDLKTLENDASMHFANYKGNWKPVDGLQHVSAVRSRTIYDKD